MDALFYLHSPIVEVQHSSQAKFDFIIGQSLPGECHLNDIVNSAAQMLTKIAIQVFLTY